MTASGHNPPPHQQQQHADTQKQHERKQQYQTQQTTTTTMTQSATATNKSLTTLSPSPAIDPIEQRSKPSQQQSQQQQDQQQQQSDESDKQDVKKRVRLLCINVLRRTWWLILPIVLLVTTYMFLPPEFKLELVSTVCPLFASRKRSCPPSVRSFARARKTRRQIFDTPQDSRLTRLCHCRRGKVLTHTSAGLLSRLVSSVCPPLWLSIHDIQAGIHGSLASPLRRAEMSFVASCFVTATASIKSHPPSSTTSSPFQGIGNT